MKLKRAKRLAREAGYTHVAVDITREIFAYPNKPMLSACGATWLPNGDDVAEYVGIYSGSKLWYATCKKV